VELPYYADNVRSTDLQLVQSDTPLRYQRELAKEASRTAEQHSPLGFVFASNVNASDLMWFRTLAQAERDTSAPSSPGSSARASTGASRPKAYVDQVLDESPLEPTTAVAREPVSEGALGPGRSTTSVRTSHFGTRIESQQFRTETGIKFDWSKESLEYGNVSISATAAYRKDPNNTDRGRDRGISFIARQTGFVVSNRTVLDNALGDHVMPANPLVARSFRFSLPATFLRGASSVIEHGDQELRLQIGRSGGLEGDRAFTFDAANPWLIGAGYRRDLGEWWSAGGQVWWVGRQATRQQHASAAAVLRYANRPGATEAMVHFLVDTQGNVGVWTDADHRVGGWRHRYGVLRLDPGLRWHDEPIGNDRLAAYWRTERRTTRDSVVLGVNYDESNIAGASNIAGVERWFGFARVGRQLNRRLRVGGTWNGTFRRQGRGLTIVEQDTYELTGFASYLTRLGNTRAEVTMATQNPHGEPDRHDYEAVLDQRWSLERGLDLSTQVRALRARGAGVHSDTLEFSTLARSELGDGIRWRADATASRTDARDADIAGLDLGTGVEWTPDRNIRIDLSGELSHTTTEPLAGPSTNLLDWEVFLELAWSDSSGQAPVRLGRRSEALGVGRITGTVFFDENRDGFKTQNELPAVGTLVLLDGRRGSARTDRNGRFELFPVFAGPHEVTLLTEELPLPWGLDDETPVPITVSARGTSEVNFALVRVSE
jgi:hypothetical protein